MFLYLFSLRTKWDINLTFEGRVFRAQKAIAAQSNILPEFPKCRVNDHLLYTTFHYALWDTVSALFRVYKFHTRLYIQYVHSKQGYFWNCYNF